MEDNPAEQVKHDEELPMRGFRDTAQWLVGLGNADRSQVYALLYIGDQVKALVELHRDAFTQGTRVIGDLVPQLAKLLAPVRVEGVPPRVSDVDPALFGYVPHRVDVDPSAELRHLVGGSWQLAPEVVGALLERSRERDKGLHATGRVHLSDCVCDGICRAITEATR